MKRYKVLVAALLLSIAIAITAWSKEFGFQLNGNETQRNSKQTNNDTPITTNKTTEPAPWQGVPSETVGELIDHFGASFSLPDLVMFGDLDRVEDSLKNGADINEQGQLQMTALHNAVGTNQAKMVKFLLSQEGIDLSVKSKYDETALDMAIKGGNKEIIKLLEDYTTQADNKRSLD